MNKPDNATIEQASGMNREMFSIHQPIHTTAFDEHGRNNGSFISNEKLNPFSNLFDRIVVSIDFISILF